MYYCIKGEHIDYNGYGVLPMALEQNIAIAIRMTETVPRSEATIDIRNTNTNYSCAVFFFAFVVYLFIYCAHFVLRFYHFPLVSAERYQRSASQPLSWHHYIMCGIRGVLEHYVKVLEN